MLENRLYIEDSGESFKPGALALIGRKCSVSRAEVVRVQRNGPQAPASNTRVSQPVGLLLGSELGSESLPNRGSGKRVSAFVAAGLAVGSDVVSKVSA